jgi:uncharacterized protein YecT (DUF1311 family)
MHNIFGKLFLIILLYCSNKAIAQSSSAESNLNECMNTAIEQGALINSHRIKCLNNYLQTIEQDLQILNQNLNKNKPPNIRRMLLASQKYWTKYRNNFCNAESYLKYLAPSSEVNYLLCMIEETKLHITKINSINN